jgi:hypothetical protein
MPILRELAHTLAGPLLFEACLHSVIETDAHFERRAKRDE